MSDASVVLLTSIDDALPAGKNALFAAARPCNAAPSFRAPFAVREVGVLFAGKTLPCFGVFRGMPEPERAAAAEQVTVLEHEAGDRFAVEIRVEQPDARLVVARAPRLATLGATIAPALARARSGPSLWDRLRGKGRFTEEDALKVPPIAVEVQDVRFRLEGGGAPATAGALTQGRGEMYRRYFVCDGPFMVLMLDKNGGALQLALWVESASDIIAAR